MLQNIWRRTFKSLLIALTIIFSTVMISTAQATDAEVSAEISEQKMAEIFRLAYYNSHIYEEDQCHSNVIRLYRFFQTQIPDLKTQDFQVHIIYSKYGIGTINGPSHKKVLPSRSRGNFLYDNVVKKPFHLWLYHVVLEYKGRIYDLDYGPKPTVFDSVSDYYTHMFDGKLTVGRFGPSAKKYSVDTELLVYRIVGDQYLLQPVYTPIIKEGPGELVLTMSEIKSGP